MLHSSINAIRGGSHIELDNLCWSQSTLPTLPLTAFGLSNRTDPVADLGEAINFAR